MNKSSTFHSQTTLFVRFWSSLLLIIFVLSVLFTTPAAVSAAAKTDEGPNIAVAVFFMVQPDEDGPGTTANWESNNEAFITGYKLWRDTTGLGDYILLTTPLIPPANPGSMLGSIYMLDDPTANPSVENDYMLETLMSNGSVYRIFYTYIPPVHRILIPLVVR